MSNTPLSSNTKLSDVDLRALIRAYNAGGITHGFVPEVYRCLVELQQMREDWKTICEAADAMPAPEPPASPWKTFQEAVPEQGKPVWWSQNGDKPTMHNGYDFCDRDRGEWCYVLPPPRHAPPPGDAPKLISTVEMLREVENTLIDLGWHKDRGVLKRVTDCLDEVGRNTPTKELAPLTNDVLCEKCGRRMGEHSADGPPFLRCPVEAAAAECMARVRQHYDTAANFARSVTQSAETAERPFNSAEAQAYGQFIEDAFEKPTGESTPPATFEQALDEFESGGGPLSGETSTSLTSAEEESLRERSDLMHKPAEF